MAEDLAPEAVQKVFDIPELLEAILLQVDDTKTLLLSQRVCKTFEAAINGSSKFRRALFFEYDPSPSNAKNDLLQRPVGTRLPGWRHVPIKTPEGYEFRIMYGVCAFVDIEFQFTSSVPTSEKPATGSWRKMYKWQGKKQTESILALLEKGDFWKMVNDDLPEHLEYACMGEIFDWTVDKLSRAPLHTGRLSS